MVFKVGDINFTRNVVMGSYKVNRKPLYKEYTGLNMKKRRQLVRYRVEGTLEMYFRNNAELVQFLNVSKPTTENGGAVQIQCTINNEHYEQIEALTFYGYLEYEPTRMTVGTRDGLAKFTVKIEER